MPLKCSVIGCRSNYDKERANGARSYSVFSFPTDPVILQQWKSILGFSEDYVLPKTARACQKHFLPSSYTKRGHQNHLTTNSLPVRDELEICDKKESAPKTAAKIEVIFKFAECPSAPVEEITEISEYVILSFEDFLQNFYEKLNLSGWSVFKDHKENNFFCLYQLKEQKNPIDVTFHCKVIIERSLEVHVMSHDPSVEESTLIESFQLEHWWQLEQTLQQHNQHSLEVVEESQLENSEEIIESNFIDDMIVVEETNSSISDQDVKEEYMEEEILEEIYLDTPKKVIELSEYKQMKEESTPVFKVPSTYTCEVCSEIFPTEQKYRKHHLTHNPIKQFIAPQKCPTCEKTFDELKKLKRHMAMCQVERRFLCDICCMKFKNKTALNSHLMRHNDANKVPCTLCGHRFFPGQDMTNHVYRHQNLKPFKCNLCEKSYGKSDALKIHLESHNSYKPKCPLCFKECRNSAMVKWHVKNNKCVLNDHKLKQDRNSLKKKKLSNYRPFPCFAEECSRKFITKQLLWTHLKDHHGLDIPNFERYCVYCQVELESNNTYMLHVRGHFCNYQCKTCGRKFKAESVLIDHQKSHEEGESRPFACDLCDLKFKSDSNLKSHKTIQHSTATPFACDQCDNVYKFKNLLERHIRTFHERNYDQKCRICRISFNSHNTLKNHMINEHETDQLYVCTLCKFTFKYLNELKQHRHDYHGDKYGRQTLKKLDPDQEIQCMEVSGDETDYLVEEDL